MDEDATTACLTCLVLVLAVGLLVALALAWAVGAL
jgi:hypothetical protein